MSGVEQRTASDGEVGMYVEWVGVVQEKPSNTPKDATLLRQHSLERCWGGGCPLKPSILSLCKLSQPASKMRSENS